MKTYVLDSHPLLVYFERQDGWEAVADMLQEASEEKCQLVLSVINWGEVYYITLREYNEEYAEKVLHALRNMPIELKDVNKEVTMNAARLKAKGGLSYADCFAAGLAMTIENSEVVTGDKKFKQVEKNVKIHWMK